MDQPPDSVHSELTPPLRVLAAADNALARAGLAALLKERPGFDVVGQCGLDDELDSALDVYRPDVVVCDMGYDPMRAVERLGDIVLGGPAWMALVADANAAAEAYPALIGAGVRGILLQSAGPEALAAATVALGQGLTVLGPGISPPLVPPLSPSAPAMGGEAFTPREREVLALLAEGLPNKLIARQLHISEHTVKFHVNALLTKLGAASRTEAVVRATRLGLIAL